MARLHRFAASNQTRANLGILVRVFIVMGKGVISRNRANND